MRSYVLRALLGSVVVVSSFGGFGCGGGTIEEGIPEAAKNQPPTEIPGEKDMNATLKK